MRDLKRELSIANTKDNPRMLRDRDEQLSIALARQHDLEEQLTAEKSRSQLLSVKVFAVHTCMQSLACARPHTQYTGPGFS